MLAGMLESLIIAEPFTEYATQTRLVRARTTGPDRYLGTPDAAAEAFRPMEQLDRECFAVAMLDGRHRLIGIQALTIGTATQAPVDSCALFRAAIVAGARGLILVHNHPSGDLEPSQDDLELTRRLVAAGQILGLNVHDHLIISHKGHASLRTARAELFTAQW